MAECWTCGAERGRAAFCTTCGKIQPVVRGTSFFETLGVAPKMRLDRDTLERAYREVSRRVHPDQFGRESKLERKLALEQTTHTNDAFRTLKKPRTRAEYLMKLRGREIGGEHDRMDDMDFLTEVMDLRETLAGATSAVDVEPLHREVEDRFEKLLLTLERFFDEGEGSEAGAVSTLEQLRFFERFLEEVDAKFERGF